MGFILSSCHRTFVWNFMTLLLISGVWRHSISVCGTLDQSEEESGQFRGSTNHVHEGAHSHEDGFCDCNSQGPWQPLFKPSQVVPRDEPELDSAHSSENSIASSSNQQIHQLPTDLVPPEFANSQRQAKKQNHMIHLHLIPHIYVPVLHPVVHPVAYGNQHPDRPLTQETHPRPVYHSSGEEPEGDYSHHNDHDRPIVPHHHLDGASAEQNIHHELSNHINVNVGADSSHESEEIHNPGGYPYYPSESLVHHQYEVHEEPSHDPYYENHPSASHTKSQILAPHTPLQLPTRPPSPPTPNLKLQYFHNRNLINKKFMNVPVNMRQLRIMRPPPLGQKETWLLRSARFPPSKTFDFSKHPFFEFKPNRRQTPLVVIPATILKRRDDRMLKT